MAFCHLYYWDVGCEGLGLGHTGLALETPSGLKTYITMLNNAGEGSAPTLPEELRIWSGIGYRDRERHRNFATQRTPFNPRPGQLAVETTGRIALGRRDSGGFRRNAGMSLVLAGGQIIQAPTEIVEIPVLTPTTFGVDTDRMFYWWRSYGMRGMRGHGEVTPRPQFKLVSARNNCAGTTALALIVGGAKYFKHRFRQYRTSTPVGVREWAKEVRDAALEINRAKALSVRYELNEAIKKRTAFEKTTKSIKQSNPRDLPTLEEWKNISYVGTFARRKEQIAAIDNALRRYHEIPQWGTERDDEKARQLDEIIRQAENHAITKPASDRLHAVTYMLAQAWKVLDDRLRTFREGEHVISRSEFDTHGSLRLSPEQFQKIFMGDEWLTEMEVEVQPVVDEEVDIDQIDTREALFASGVSEDLQANFFQSGVSGAVQSNLFQSGVSQEVRASVIQRSLSNRHSSTNSLGSMQGR